MKSIFNFIFLILMHFTCIGQCESFLSNTWSGIGNTYSTVINGITTTFSSPDTPGSNTTSFSPNGNFFNQDTDVWSNSNVVGSNSLQFTVNWDDTPDGSEQAIIDSATKTVTIVFSEPVINPIIHIDRLGGNFAADVVNQSYFSNTSLWELVTDDVSMLKLCGNSQFIVDNSSFFREPNVNLGSANDPIGGELDGTNGTNGSAAGSVVIIGEVSTLTFQVSGLGQDGLGAIDGIEMIFELDSDYLSCNCSLEAYQPFITTWKTDNPGMSCNSCIEIPTSDGIEGNIYSELPYNHTYNYDIDWNNDGLWDEFGLTGNASHNYGTPGIYEVAIRGDFPHLYFYHLNDEIKDNDKIINVKRWGDIVWENMSFMFYDCDSLLGFSASSPPNLSEVFDLTGIFWGASNFNHNINNWNIENVEYLKGSFYNAKKFNHSLSSWNTSSVTNMNASFSFALNFNQNISNWDISSVSNLSYCFLNASDFNQPLSQWDVGKVENMAGMFNNASSFNQELSTWNLQSVTVDISSDGLDNMLRLTDLSLQNYEATLLGWSQNPNTPSNLELGAENLQYCDETGRNALIDILGWTFEGDSISTCCDDDCPDECGDIGEFCDDGDSSTSNDTIQDDCSCLGSQVLDGTSFITTWKTDNPGTSCNNCISIPTIENIFQVDYNYDIDWENDGVWDDINVTGSIIHEYDSPGTYQVAIRGDFPALYHQDPSGDNDKLIDVNQWGENQWLDMSNMFRNCDSLFSFSATDSPNLKDVESIHRIFLDADNFNGDISTWDVSNVTDMSSAFGNALTFNQDLSSWDVSNVDDMKSMFGGATSFNQEIGVWNTSNVTEISGMFLAAESFNGNIETWDVSNIIRFSGMFAGATLFNQPLNNWDISNAIFMNSMFSGAESFNQPLNNWNTSNLINISTMFNQATSFNQDLSSWDVSNVEFIYYLFAFAENFNQSLENWDLKSVIYDTSSVNPTSLEFMLRLCGMSIENYESTLYGWSQNENTPNGLLLDALGLQYCDETGRNALINNLGWTINGDSKADNCDPDCDVQLYIGTQNPTCEEPFSSIIWLDNVSGQLPFEITLYNSDTTIVDEWTIEGLPIGTYQIQIFDDLSCPLDTTVTLVMDGIGSPCNDNNPNTINDSIQEDCSCLGSIPVDCGMEISTTWTKNNDLVYTSSINGVNVTLSSPDALGSLSTTFSPNGAFNTYNNGNWSNDNVTGANSLEFVINWDNTPDAVEQATEDTANKVLSIVFSEPVTDPIIHIDRLGGNYLGAGNVAYISNSSYWQLISPSIELIKRCGNTQLIVENNSFYREPNITLGTSAPGGEADGSDGTNGSAAGSIQFLGTFEELVFEVSGVGPDGGAAIDGIEMIVELQPNLESCNCSNPSGEDTFRPFITTWKTDNPGKTCDSCIEIPTNSNYQYNYDVDWDNDGVWDEFGLNGNAFHDYETPGTYEVAIKGQFPNIYFKHDINLEIRDNLKLVDVIMWGHVEWMSMNSSFYHCDSISIFSASDTPNLNNVSDFKLVFHGASNFNTSINNWDVSSVTDLSGAFWACDKFNQDLKDWDVSRVEKMSLMFSRATSFNQDISNWNVSNVNTMQCMFSGATSFNQNLNTWNVANVESMFNMFQGSNFNLNISNWDVSNVTDMRQMFNDAIFFNQDISSWEVSNVITMQSMFSGATSFNQNLDLWSLKSISHGISLPTYSLVDMLKDSGVSIQNYEATLLGWSQNPNTPSDLELGAESLQYCDETGRNALINNLGWTINGDSKATEEECDDICLSTQLTITPSQTEPTCSNPNGGEIILNPGGGQSPYTCQWTGPMGPLSTTNCIASNLSGGIYNVTITDNNNCQSPGLQFTLDEAEPFELSCSPLSIEINSNESISLNTLAFNYQLSGCEVDFPFVQFNSYDIVADSINYSDQFSIIELDCSNIGIQDVYLSVYSNGLYLGSCQTLLSVTDSNQDCTDCPDPGTCNTDCAAGDIETWNDTTCTCETTVITVFGCTNTTACNYDPLATCDDGSCLMFDCCIEQANYGDPCDDGNPDTGNDVYQTDCTCSGQATDCDPNDFFIMFLEALSPSCDPLVPGQIEFDVFGGTSPINAVVTNSTSTFTNQWILTDLVADTYLFTVTDAAGCTDQQTIVLSNNDVGMPCDDGNPNTINDVYDNDCNCAGVLIAGCVIEYELNTALCDDNGTAYDVTDDLFTVGISPNGNGFEEWNSTLGVSGTIGDEVLLGPFSIVDGAVAFTLYSSDSIDCNIEVVLSPPLPCSLDCDEAIMLEDDIISATFNEEIEKYLGSNDTYPAEATFSLITENLNELSNLSIDSTGIFTCRVVKSFIDPIEVLYQVCLAECNLCREATLTLTNEDLLDYVFTDIISPNEDGQNDLLRFSKESQIPNSQLYIFNRWGNKIYEAENYTNDWDAKGYPGGIYYYVLELNGLTIKKTLTILK